MNDVEQAEKVIRDLEEKHESLIGRTKVLCKQRQEVAYAAIQAIRLPVPD
jgi:hypothetical protein